MSYYSDEPRNVRVDFFKPSGKWYTTECVHWCAGWNPEQDLVDMAFKKSLHHHLKSKDGKDFEHGRYRLGGMIAVSIPIIRIPTL